MSTHRGHLTVLAACRKLQATAAEKASKEANLSSAEKKAAEVKQEDGVKKEEEGSAAESKPSDGVVVVKAEENGEHEEEEEDSDDEFEEHAGEVRTTPSPVLGPASSASSHFLALPVVRQLTRCTGKIVLI